MKTQECIYKFMHHECAKANSVESVGYKLYSYGTVIAQWKDDILYVNTTKYSSTTSRHQGYLEREIPAFMEREGLVIRVGDLYRGVTNLY